MLQLKQILNFEKTKLNRLITEYNNEAFHDKLLNEKIFEQSRIVDNIITEYKKLQYERS